MKKKLLFPCLLLVAVMLLTCVATLGVGAEETMTMTAVAAGEKTPAEGDVVTIADAAELKKFSAYVSNSGVTKGITFRLEADIALSREAMGVMVFTNINPIGGVFNIAGAETPVAFEGIFDGNGKLQAREKTDLQRKLGKKYEDLAIKDSELVGELAGVIAQKLAKMK